MKRFFFVILAGIGALAVCGSAPESGFEHFITRQQDRLMDGDREFRFVSFNIPNLHYIEDNMAFRQTNPWRFPNEFEIRDALKAVRQLGGGVVRVYTLSVRKQGEDDSVPRHVLGPGEFNEEGFQALDRVLAVANETGIRVIIPLVDNWVWWGGIAEYAAFRGKPKNAFWTDPEIIADFKKTIDFVIHRVNTVTGVRYSDDKAILAWETGNELQCPHTWTREIAMYIQEQDINHLVIDGFHTSRLKEESVNESCVDIVTTHHYPRSEEQLIGNIRRNRELARGKKPYFLGEMGFIGNASLLRGIETVMETGVSGVLLWSLRFRNRDGGFYWHSEPMGGDLYKAYLWPGFHTGDPYQERELLAAVQEKAYAIRGLEVPEPAVPDPPVLLPVEDAGSITWLGSVGARSYDVERAADSQGPWETAGKGITEVDVQYRPLFNDSGAEPGGRYYYRVLARNESGLSGPSNTAGPVEVKWRTFIDEMRDTGKMELLKGEVRFEQRDARKVKEDMHRLIAPGGTILVYRTPGSISGWKIYMFFPKDIQDPDILISADGTVYKTAESRRKDFFSGTGEYGYWKPILYSSGPMSPDIRYLKIETGTGCEISRIEIRYEE
jgi:hypothetical protein